jgi:hypothetical protein
MPRELFIVGRDRVDLYRYLSQTFADAENVEVIWDRREGERRRRGSNGVALDRRRRDRRTRLSADEDLKTVGYVFLALD